MNTIQTVIGLDFGTKKTGIAIGQTMLKSAQALTSIPTIRDIPNPSALKKIIEEWQPDIAIIGKPASAQKPFIKKLDKLASYLQDEYQIESIFIDESLTTEQANFELYEAKTKKHRRQSQRDAIAARLILETYFETL